MKIEQNNIYMKHLLKILFLLPLFFSCTNTQEEPIPTPDEEQAPIGFKTKGLNSRVEVSDKNQIKDFKVYAVISDKPDENYEVQSDVVYSHILTGNDSKGELVYWDDDAKEFTYDDIQYWVKERTFHFFGFWPAETSAAIGDDGVSYTLTYKATETSAKNRDDLLTFHFSTYVDTDQATFEAIPVTFNRVLTQVSLEIMQDLESNPHDEFLVTSVSFSGIKAGGTFTTSRFDKTGQWHFTEDKLGFSNEYNTNNNLKDRNLTAFDGLNLVPQSIDRNTIAIVVNYTYQQGDAENGLVGEPVEKKATVYIPISEWLPGMKYNYKMALYQNNLIVFKNINVSTWGEQPDAGTIIIK